MNSHWTALNTTEFSYQIWSCPILLLKPKTADWLMCFRLLRWIFMSLFWLVCRNLMGSYEFVLWWCGSDPNTCIQKSRTNSKVWQMFLCPKVSYRDSTFPADTFEKEMGILYYRKLNKTNKKPEFLIFYRATLSFGVFGVKNTTYKILSILMHI